jgi:predicted nucleic acid-binding Zn ribbon protein
LKCPDCGAMNPDGMKYCGSCGKNLPSPAVEPAGPATRHCVQCGRPISWDANVCMYCGRDYRAKVTRAGTEGYLTTGAVLILVAAILGIALLTLTIDAWRDLPVTSLALLTISYACAIMGILGGYAALARRLFPIAVLGASCAIFTPAFFFAIPGLVLIAKSAGSFREYESQPGV